MALKAGRVGILPSELTPEGKLKNAELLPATAETLGGVKIGEGITIAEDGTISVSDVGGDVEIINATATISTYKSTWSFSEDEYTNLKTALTNEKYCIIKCAVGAASPNQEYKYGYVIRSYGNTIAMAYIDTANIYTGSIYADSQGAYSTLTALIPTQS